MALVGAIIGLPMFFEIGLVLLMPVIYLVARRSQLSLITVGIPALAGLSAMHGFVQPHPGPLTAVGLLNADLGLTLALGVVVAIPTIIVAGPLFGKLAGKWVVVEAPDTFDADRFAEGTEHRRWRLQTGAGRHRHRNAAGGMGQAGQHLGPDTRLGERGADPAGHRFGETVATITASSLMLGLVEGMPTGQISLVVLAVGAGSLFFSHVNDAGFWLVNQYFRISVGQTIKTWSIMETVLSVVGLIVVLILDIFI